MSFNQSVVIARHGEIFHVDFVETIVLVDLYRSELICEVFVVAKEVPM